MLIERSFKAVLVGVFPLLLISFAACVGPKVFDPSIGVPPDVLGSPANPGITFSVAADMRGFVGLSASAGGTQFRAALDALASYGAGAFMLGPGDIDPPIEVRNAIDDGLGAGFPWFPVVGNHEAETTDDMAYLRACALPGGAAGIANFAYGPAGAANTMYSFDAGAAHFAIVNEYYDGSSDVGVNPPPSSELAGTISAATYAWLEADLAAAAAIPALKYLFVVGHEPAWPMPDAANGRLRHRGDSLDAHPSEVDAFVSLLKSYGVSAYICGHTHDYSAALVDGLLQIDAGHARGTGDAGAMSTFLRFELFGNMALMSVYRSSDGIAYPPAATVRIAPRAP